MEPDNIFWDEDTKSPFEDQTEAQYLEHEGANEPFSWSGIDSPDDLSRASNVNLMDTNLDVSVFSEQETSDSENVVFSPEIEIASMPEKAGQENVFDEYPHYFESQDTLASVGTPRGPGSPPGFTEAPTKYTAEEWCEDLHEEYMQEEHQSKPSRQQRQEEQNEDLQRDALIAVSGGLGAVVGATSGKVIGGAAGTAGGAIFAGPGGSAIGAQWGSKAGEAAGSLSGAIVGGYAGGVAWNLYEDARDLINQCEQTGELPDWFQEEKR
ncbi:hypothetical protein [Gloeobacter morelensis]|uniref:Glycine zipper domain-containing protein n=1 Tax=Gloeobacter morelensis MG652769 TaxID=2781736 RepID=A0ABY3PIL3_9CYAN|nr:hypothetical protein [Gloeobacter morelensis]UFP93393.1 hypothetical protein ISF26_16525 [Gloeobacter morelensis MG652769]